MKFDTHTTIEQFREEMQHRVVRYPLNSRPVKEALRFAKHHPDPAFYRVASDKLHAQRQYQRELYGPGKLERLIDFISLGSLREVVVTLLLVTVGVIGLDIGRRAMQPRGVDAAYEHMDIDRLAAQLGLALETIGVPERVTPGAEALEQDDAANEHSTSSDQTSRLSNEDVARIAEAVMQRLTSQHEAKVRNVQQTSATSPPAETESLAALTDEDRD